MLGSLDDLDLLHAIARPSVPTSVYHTGVSYKTVEVMIMKFSHHLATPPHL